MITICKLCSPELKNEISMLEGIVSNMIIHFFWLSTSLIVINLAMMIPLKTDVISKYVVECHQTEQLHGFISVVHSLVAQDVKHLIIAIDNWDQWSINSSARTFHCNYVT